MMRQGLGLLAPPGLRRELVIRGVGRAVIATGALIVVPSAHSQSAESSGAGFQLVSRCSNAARIVAGAAERSLECRADSAGAFVAGRLQLHQEARGALSFRQRNRRSGRLGPRVYAQRRIIGREATVWN